MSSQPSAVLPDHRARLAGVLYLVCIAAGFSAEFFVRDRIVVYSDAALTAQNILASPWLYRAGFFADLISFTSGIIIAVIFYGLFSPVSRPLARLALTFAIVSNTVSLASSIFCFAPLQLLGGADYLKSLSTGQLQSLALFSLKLYQFAFALNLGLFSIDCLATGYLIFRSQFLPRILGVLLAIGGLCYLTNSIAYFLPPRTFPDLFPFIYLPSLVAELSLALWLTLAGVNRVRWRAVADAARGNDG
jgi:hypothetical protein